MRGFGPNLAKLLIFIFNAIFFLLGLAVVGISAYILSNQTKIIDEVSTTFDFNLGPVIKILLALLIVIGSSMLLIGFFGCCGALMESTCMLSIYSFCLFLIGVFYVAFLIYAIYTGRQNNIADLFQNLIKNDYTAIGNEIKNSTKYQKSRVFDIIQIYFGCCGIESYKDFNSQSEWEKSKLPGQQLPYACCNMTADNRENFLKKDDFLNIKTYLIDATQCQEVSVTNPYFNPTGCNANMAAYIQQKRTFMFICTIVPLAAIIIGVILAYCLIRAIKLNTY